MSNFTVAELSEAKVAGLLDRARSKAADLGVAVCIAVVDAGGHLKSFIRMDGSILGAVDVAQRKARTAAMFGAPSGEFGTLVVEERLLGMELTNGGLVGFPGGLPIYYAETLIGALGVSGATANEDLEIACAAVNF